MPVYVVHQCEGTGNDRTLHRNMLFPLSLPLSETLGEGEQAEASDEDVGYVTQKRVARASPVGRDDDSDDSDEEHYVQVEDPGSFMGTRNEDHGDMSTVSEDSDLQSGVPQGAQEEPVDEGHTSSEVDRSVSEIPGQPLRRSARNTCRPIRYRDGTYLLYPQTASAAEWKAGFDVMWNRFPEKRQETAIEGCKCQWLNYNCALSRTTIFK